MNKTISITLNGSLFHMEEEAYQKLNDYLQSIRKHFAKDEDRDEIVADIERSVGEQFSEKLTASKQVITVKDVDELMKKMGTIEDFKKFEGKSDEKEEPEKEPSKEKETKKLYRNPDDQIIAGVASGLGSYFNVDPNWIRLLFLVSISFGGLGIIVYIILWILVPEAKTTGEKIEMQGDSLTLAAIEEKIKSAASAAEKKLRSGEFEKGLQKFFEFLRKVVGSLGYIIKKLFSIVGKIVGVFIIFITGLMMAAVTFIFLAGLIGNEALLMQMNFPIREFFEGIALYLAIFSGYLILLIPLIFLIIIGTSLVKNKSAFTTKISLSLFALWILAIMVWGLNLFNEMPNFEKKWQNYKASYESGQSIVTQNFDLSNFSAIEAEGSYEIIVKKDDHFSISATGSQKELDQMIMIVNENRLIITRKICFLVCLWQKEPTIQITAPTLKNLQLSGSVNAEISGFSENEMQIYLSGASQAKMETTTQKFVTYISGASSLNLSGSSQELTAKLSGSSELHGFNFKTEKTDIDLSGASSAEIDTLKDLKADLSGASTLNYVDRPMLSITQKTSGASNIYSETFNY
jgi:phage shock protein PspC (stress-responsive transcriptional regulator)